MVMIPPNNTHIIHCIKQSPLFCVIMNFISPSKLFMKILNIPRTDYWGTSNQLKFKLPITVTPSSFSQPILFRLPQYEYQDAMEKCWKLFQSQGEQHAQLSLHPDSQLSFCHFEHNQTVHAILAGYSKHFPVFHVPKNVFHEDLLHSLTWNWGEADQLTSL